MADKSILVGTIQVATIDMTKRELEFMKVDAR